MTQGGTGKGYVVAETTTDMDGRWRRPMALDPNTYTLVFYKPGEYNVTTVDITVTEE